MPRSIYIRPVNGTRESVDVEFSADGSGQATAKNISEPARRSVFMAGYSLARNFTAKVAIDGRFFAGKNPKPSPVGRGLSQPLNFLHQPRPRKDPVAARGALGNSQHLRHLLERKPDEIPLLHQLRLPRIVGGEVVERLVEEH